MSKNIMKPPTFALFLLRRMAKYNSEYELNGDIEEEYREHVDNLGIRSAKLWFWKHALRSIPAYLKYTNFWSFMMSKNYIKIAIRNIRRNKGFSIINISGLTIGLAVCILISLWVRDELSFDKFHENYDSIYRVITQETYQGQPTLITRTVGALFKASKEEIPEIAYAARTHRSSGKIIRYGDKIFAEDEFLLTDQDFFAIFSFQITKGDPANVLVDPNSIVLTEEMAAKYFGKDDPIGKILNIDSQYDLVVTGIVENIPGNSHLQFDFLSPAQNIDRFIAGEGYAESWRVGAFSTYLLLVENSLVEEVGLKVDELYKRNSENENAAMNLQPFKDVHFYSTGRMTIALAETSSIRFVYIFSSIAAIVLLIACINFMNLTTAQAGKRSKEVGLRKVAGAHRKDLIYQYLGEAVFLSLIALVFASIMVLLLLPAFNSLSGKEMEFISTKNLGLFSGLFGITVITGLLAGTYPAFYLSSFQPVKVIKGVMKKGQGGSKIRRMLVVGQFGLSIFLIIFTVIVYTQLNFMKNKDLGYDKEQVIYLDYVNELRTNYDTFETELLKNSNITEITASSNLPTRGILATVGVDWDGRNSDEPMSMEFTSVDYGYIETFGIDILQGRSFQEEFMDEEYYSLILNRKALDLTGYKSPLGKLITFGRNQGKILGVVDDYHFESLHTEIKPMIMISIPAYFNHIYVKLNSDDTDLKSVIDYMENIWTDLNPNTPFEYHFLDEEFESQYKNEQRFGKIFNYSTILAIFISALGLFG
ncbi:MAG: FtsX-like permease family protein, partial [bacterium]|nr:FtsX-like permease family protein [bacterium]